MHVSSCIVAVLKLPTLPSRPKLSLLMATLPVLVTPIDDTSVTPGTTDTFKDDPWVIVIAGFGTNTGVGVVVVVVGGTVVVVVVGGMVVVVVKGGGGLMTIRTGTVVVVVLGGSVVVVTGTVVVVVLGMTRAGGETTIRCCGVDVNGIGGGGKTAVR